MLDELVFKTQAIGIEHTVLIHYDRVVQTAAQCQALRAHVFHILHEAKGTRATDVAYVRIFVKVDRDVLLGVGKDRVGKIDGKGQFIAVVRLESNPLIALFHLDCLFNPDEFFRRRLLNDACRLQQKNERTGTAIHDRYFRTIHFYTGIIYPQTCQRRHQVFDGGNPHAILLHACGQPRVMHQIGARFHFTDRFHIHATKHDAAVYGAGAQGQRDLLAAV